MALKKFKRPLEILKANMALKIFDLETTLKMHNLKTKQLNGP